MSMLSSTFCLKCERIYDLEKRRICIGKCTHSICESCFDQKLSDSCPTCEVGNAFSEKTINYGAEKVFAEKMKTFTIGNALENYFEEKNVGEGACSECRLPSKKLRVCVDCATRSGLLISSKDGIPRLSTETANELLETKILRVRSVAVCADCALDGVKHKGHNIEFVTRIKEMKYTVETLDCFSGLALISEKIDDESKEYKQMAGYVKFNLVHIEISKFLDQMPKMANSLEENDMAGLTYFFNILKTCYDELCSLKEAVEDQIEKAKRFMENAECEKEKKEWEKTIDKLESFRDYFASREKDIDWKSVIEDTIKVYESGIFGKFVNEARRMEKQELSNITKDFWRTLKLPKAVEKYANVAGSVVKFFMGNDEKVVEELELD